MANRRAQLAKTHNADQHTALRKNITIMWIAWTAVLGIMIFGLIYGSVLLVTTGSFTAIPLIALTLFGLWYHGGFFITVPASLFLLEYGKKHPVRAEHAYVRALSLARLLQLRKDCSYASMVGSVAFLRHEKGELIAAEGLYEEAVSILEKHKQARYPHFCAALNNLSTVYIKDGRFEQAEQSAKAALAIWEEQSKSEYTGSGIPLTNLGFVRLRLNDLDGAEDFFLTAKRRFEGSAPGMILPVSITHSKGVLYVGLALTYAKKKRLGDLKSACRLLFNHLEKDPTALGIMSVDVLVELIEDCMNLNEVELAASLSDIGYEIARSRCEHPYAPGMLETYERVLTAQGRQNEIADMKRWLLPSRQHQITQLEDLD